MQEGSLRAICAISLLTTLFALTGGNENTAMDYIIKANMGKEEQMNVDKFDIRLPSFVSGATGDQQNAAARDVTRLWPNGVVPYIVDKSLLLRSMYKKNLEKAIKEWTTYTCLKFRKREKTDRDYVVFGYGVGCNADVGKKGDRQYVTLGKGCSDTSVIMHEIGHVVGFWHEQNRPDRDRYVDILWDNIIDEYEFAFSKYSDRRINSYGVSYDYKSIMHYGNKAWAKDKRKPTIVAKNGGTNVFGNLHLSPLDIKQTNILYHCPAIESLYPKFPQEFLFSANGSRADKRCVIINESRKRKQKPMWLCYKKTKNDAGIRWSDNGKIPYSDCTHISSPFGNDRHGFWRDNYLCVANNSVYKLHWVKERPIPGLGCLEWPNIRRRARNRWRFFLCVKSSAGPIDGGWSTWSTWTKCSKECGGGYQERRRYCTNPEPKNYGKPCYGVDYEKRYCNLHQCREYPVWPGDFMFSHFAHTPYDKNCIRIYDRQNELFWRNFYFCSVGNKRRVNMVWSDMGPQLGRICTKINEPKEKKGWDNNHLCVSPRSQYRFQWSNSGPIDGLRCLQWLAKNGTDGWNDNYLCCRKVKQTAAQTPLSVSSVINGGWTKWSKWSRCSKSCNWGYQRRSRSCTEPTPSAKGKRCRGGSKERRDCKIRACRETCNADYKGDKGNIYSPNFPRYPQNVTCRWKITVAKGKRVQMKFTYVKVKGYRSKCSSDSVVVRNGDMRTTFLKRFCHNFRSPKIVYSTGNIMFLELRTSDALTNGGFKAEWDSKPIPKKDTCGGTLSDLSGTFTSPLYPNKYPNNRECSWLIIVPIDRLLKVKFDDFQLESDGKCSYDKVEILDGGTSVAPKRTFCGTKNPGVFTAFTNRMLIRFKSDLTKNRRGFKATWFTTKRSFPSRRPF